MTKFNFKNYVKAPEHTNLPLFDKLESLASGPNDYDMTIVENEINVYNALEDIRILLRSNIYKKITVIVHCRDQALVWLDLRTILADLEEYKNLKFVIISQFPHHWQVELPPSCRFLSKHSRFLYIYYPEYSAIYWNIYKDVKPLRTDRKFSKHFLCLNKRGELLRQVLYYKFYNENWLEKSHFSYLCENHIHGKLFDTKTFQAIDKMIKDSHQWDQLTQPSQMFLEIENDTLLKEYCNFTGNASRIDPSWKVEDNLYEDSFCSIVVETDSSGDYVNVSEKAFRPIVLQHPMILFSSAKTNIYLKELGLDYDLYDTIFYKWDSNTVMHDWARFDTFVDHIAQIEKMSITDLHELNQKIEHRLVEARKRYIELYDIMLKKQERIFFTVERFLGF